MALKFDRDFEPRTGAAVEVAPGVRRVTAPNAGPFTFHGTNTFLIGRDPLAILDPGPADPAHLDALIYAIGSARVGHILVSHTHRDHSPGARLLQARTDAPILAAGPHRPARPARPGEELRLDASADLEFSPDEALADGGMVEGPGYRLEAVATPGHTGNHLAFALAGTDILFSGDHVMGWSTTVVAPPDGAMADYMASLDRLLERPESRYLPAHGGPIGNAHAYVRALRAHRKMREGALPSARRPVGPRARHARLPGARPAARRCRGAVDARASRGSRGAGNCRRRWPADPRSTLPGRGDRARIGLKN